MHFCLKIHVGRLKLERAERPQHLSFAVAELIAYYKQYTNYVNH
jgi:hypothetical protein